jgi:transcriptional regulator with XRE-family HTH domain
MEAAEVLRRARQRQGITQRELANRAGTSQPVVSAYEHGRRDPSIGTLARLVAATGERLVVDLAPPSSDLPPPATREEHAERLVDLLLLVDALPARPAGPLRMPRLGAER